MPFAHILFKYDHSVRQREVERIRAMVQEKQKHKENKHSTSRLVKPKDSGNGRRAHVNVEEPPLTNSFCTRQLAVVSVVSR